MMEVLQFLLSGPGWGWRALVAVISLNIIVDGIVSTIEAIASVFRKVNHEFDDIPESGDEGVTIDDVRS